MRVHNIESLFYTAKLPSGVKLVQGDGADGDGGDGDKPVKQLLKSTKKMNAKKQNNKKGKLIEKELKPSLAAVEPVSEPVEPVVSEPVEPLSPVEPVEPENIIEEIQQKIEEPPPRKLTRAEKAEIRRKEREELLAQMKCLVENTVSEKVDTLKNVFHTDLNGLTGVLDSKTSALKQSLQDKLMSSYEQYTNREREKYNRRLNSIRMNLIR